MRVLFVLIAVAMMAGCAGAPKNPTWITATGAEQHERLLWQAVHAKDWSTVERQLSATFIGVSADGRTFDRAGWVQLLNTAQVQQYSLGDMQVQPEGPDMKLTYVLHLQATALAPQSPEGLRVVSIWQQVKRGWMLAASSITPIQKNN